MNHKLLEELIGELRTLRSELDGKVEPAALERIDHAIFEIARIGNSRENLKNALVILGFALEQLPSIIKLLESLFNR